ncbi:MULTISPECIES: acyl-CoA dehydrogenase family protein [Oleiagrimonas]|uniref:3-sulfinopropanoyl-CoA desulfinase n=1 Tax=Oleiagrimonas citrea TaxID=1665687 RepID=A0A846ZK54_9GAMM|nr:MULTISPECIES: acyl-CoA dehydrogenase family protein [Oleiagrimonas]NKZ37761.1 acyl-CoA dehydrogenase [Oleiagrimonas citrea]RAP56319.1 acyl-CoA dehydrogenase [Oleiagrimonas sp. MCCC 1A03011]
MDFSFNDDQLSIQSIAREFAQKRIAPVAAEFDASGEFPLDNIREMGQMGLMGIEVPSEYGGAGMDPISYVLAMIEIAAADAAHSTIMSVNNSLFCNGILTHGTEEQKQKYVKAIATGEAIGAYALTEPQSGSDASNMHTRAVKSEDGKHFVINGKKSWITSGPVAKYIVLFAITKPGIGAKGVSAFIIDTEVEGFHRGKTEPKLGIRASATCEIEFVDYKCPVENLLGEEGQGFKIAMGVLDAGRIGIASQALGVARAAYEATLEWSRERKAFGQPIGSFQMTQSKIADMKCKLDAATLMTLRAAWTKQQVSKTGGRFGNEASMAKLMASEAAMWITHQAIQIHGGMGYSKEMPLERYFRDAKITEIYEGTSEIQRMVIARNETGLR